VNDRFSWEFMSITL